MAEMKCGRTDRKWERTAISMWGDRQKVGDDRQK